MCLIGTHTLFMLISCSFFWRSHTKTWQSSNYKTRGSLELILKTLSDEHI